MLILGRKPDEAIIIGDGIRVVVIACDRQGVRLGIEAPPDVSILREEIVTSISEENRRAAARTTSAEWVTLVPPRKERPGDDQDTGTADGASTLPRPCA